MLGCYGRSKNLPEIERRNGMAELNSQTGGNSVDASDEISRKRMPLIFPKQDGSHRTGDFDLCLVTILD
jgi:hypothetical protein